MTEQHKSCLYCKEHFPNKKCPHVEIDEIAEHKDQWFCIYCDEWHKNTELCSVYEVRSMREERYERMLND